MRRLLGSICVTLALLTAARANDSATLFARLDRAAAATTLYAPTLKPWHMKVDFTVYDEDGKNPQEGTLEEWWGGPNQDRITYTSPAYTGTVLKIDKGSFSTPDAGSIPFALETLHNALVNPLTPEVHPEKYNPAFEKVPFGKVTLDCITLTPKSIPASENSPRGLYPTYCFDPGSQQLLYSTRYVNEAEVRNRLGRFQGQTVAVALKLTEAAFPQAEGRVITLETVPVTAMDFAATGLELDRPAQTIPASVLAGGTVRKVTPVYPESAKRRRVQGNVLLRATIGTDGKVREITIVSTPDSDLAIAAVASARQWLYTPYLLNGKPTELNATLTVQFRIQ
jgi:TonB family protein